MNKWLAVDARAQDAITAEQAEFFRANGLLVLRGLLHGEELAALQRETGALVERARRERVADPDYAYKRHELTGEEVPYRIEYVIEKTTAGKALLGHPFILRSVERLQGPSFIPTWDSCVFKNEGAGAAITWHRDSGTEFSDPRWPIFNVDFYLDRADRANCLWGLPGSHRWPAERAAATLAELTAGGEFRTDGATPLEMEPGDVLFHDILVLHGSPACHSPLRRVVYYEFRPAELETTVGPHRPEYVPVKQQVLLACLRDRSLAPYAHGETPYEYHPEPPYTAPPLAYGEALRTYRYPHAEWWRGPR